MSVTPGTRARDLNDVVLVCNSGVVPQKASFEMVETLCSTPPERTLESSVLVFLLGCRCVFFSCGGSSPSVVFANGGGVPPHSPGFCNL